MDKNKTNVPKIRFPGFTDPWEQRKLDVIADVRDGTHDSPQYFSEGHPFVTSKNVKEGQINYEDIQYISDVDFDEINKRSKVDKNDILMGMIGTIGNIALVRENPDFTIKNVALIKDTKSVYYLYLYHYLQSPIVLKQLDNGMDGGTQKFIALNKIRNLSIAVPESNEQHKIGDYLENFDNLITLHQRKLNHLQDKKKSLLQKMFPKNGEYFPELRFPGFTDPWEQHKLGDISDVTKLAGFEFTEYVIYSDEGTIIALRGLNVKNGKIILDDVKYIDQSDFSKLNRSKLFKDDILFTYVGTVGELAIIPEDNKYYLAPNVARIRLKKEINSQFVIQMMGNKTYYDKVIFPLIATSSQPALSMENVRKFILKLPNFEEQTKIAGFFVQLDNLINLHQCKLNHLQEQKKALLQQMFV